MKSKGLDGSNPKTVCWSEQDLNPRAPSLSRSSAVSLCLWSSRVPSRDFGEDLGEGPALYLYLRVADEPRNATYALRQRRAAARGRECRYELKLDGFQAIGRKSGRSAQLWSRNQKDFTRDFPITNC